MYIHTYIYIIMYIIYIFSVLFFFFNCMSLLCLYRSLLHLNEERKGPLCTSMLQFLSINNSIHY